MIWRDLKVRYKQAVIGIAWAVLRPLVTAFIYFLVFYKVTETTSTGGPRLSFLSVFAGMAMWELFAGSVSRASGSLVSSANLLTKVYFPRLVIPLAAVLVGLVDFGLICVLVAAGMVAYGVVPGIGLLALPLFVLMALLTAAAAGVWLSALNVRYRDVSLLVPFLVLVWFLLSPVFYSIEIIPEGTLRTLYSLNPMTGVLQGLRWGLFDGPAPTWAMVGSWVAVLVMLVTGIRFFTRAERSFADVV